MNGDFQQLPLVSGFDGRRCTSDCAVCDFQEGAGWMK